MLDAAYCRLKARQCRELAELATMPEVRDQLVLFADEFDAHAGALDRMEASEAPKSGSSEC